MDKIKCLVDSYFSEFIGKNIYLFNKNSINVYPTDKRELDDNSWAQPFKIWIHQIKKTVIISIKPSYYSFFDKLVKDYKTNDIFTYNFLRKISDFLELNYIPSIANIYYCNKIISKINDVKGLKKLSLSDLSEYINFLQSLYPNNNEHINFLLDGIKRDIENEFSYGIFIDKTLVSVTSMSMIPYMQDTIEEIGVATLPNYRNMGFGKIVLSHSTNEILKKNKIPICRCDSNNIISNNLVIKTGYKYHSKMIGFI